MPMPLQIQDASAAHTEEEGEQEMVKQLPEIVIPAQPEVSPTDEEVSSHGSENCTVESGMPTPNHAFDINGGGTGTTDNNRKSFWRFFVRKRDQPKPSHLTHSSND